MNTANLLLLTNLALNAAMQAAEFSRVVQNAIAEGRDVSDAEVAAARAKAAAAVDTLATPGPDAG